MAIERTLPESRTPDEARAEIARARAQIVDSAAQLRREMARATQWGQWVGRHPALFLGGAFALGFLIAYRRD